MAREAGTCSPAIGFFGVIFAVNGVFLYMALSTHTSASSRRSRTARACTTTTASPPPSARRRCGGRPTRGSQPESGALTLALTDASGLPVPGLEISGAIGRPSTVQHDTALFETAPGRYAADVGLREPGDWLLTLEAARETSAGCDIVYRLRRRVWLKP